MRYSALAIGLLALSVSACATVNSLFDDRADERFSAGMAALSRGDYSQANTDLGWVAENYADERVGQRALLILSGLEVDPRNPRRRISLGADLAAAYLRLPEKERWTDPVAQALYLLALELGAAEERVAQAEADRQAAERRAYDALLPQLPESASTVPTRLRAMTEERDKLARKVEQLETDLADRDKKLADKEKELDRIRKTLKS
ncbi:MAG TPA: hypothetical protein VK877_00430 [Pseudolabrys sp.]|nr:hypothetical protein [Pseudolabrys sp.]